MMSVVNEIVIVCVVGAGDGAHLVVQYQADNPAGLKYFFQDFQR